MFYPSTPSQSKSSDHHEVFHDTKHKMKIRIVQAQECRNYINVAWWITMIDTNLSRENYHNNFEDIAL